MTAFVRRQFGKFVDYGKLVAFDYRTVFVETVQDGVANKLRSAVVLAGLATAYVAHRSNPTEHSYRDQLVDYRQQLMQVGSVIQNPDAKREMHAWTTLLNEKRVTYYNCSFFSLMLRETLSTNCALYKTQCKSIRPSILELPERIEDVGFWGRWWLLDARMKDFDMDPAEWEQTEQLK